MNHSHRKLFKEFISFIIQINMEANPQKYGLFNDSCFKRRSRESEIPKCPNGQKINDQAGDQSVSSIFTHLILFIDYPGNLRIVKY